VRRLADAADEALAVNAVPARATARPLRVLTVSSLYPNLVMPTHGVFVENRLRRLLGTGRIDLRVTAPVPWLPAARVLGETYARWARVPAVEERHSIPITHPRYLHLPKIGMSLQPRFMHRALARHVEGLLREGHRFELIDAHYFYPDGVAAAWLGRELGLPVVITARGTDLNLIPRFPGPRRMIQEAARSAAGLITVCAALKDVLVELGVPAERVAVLRNGVDLELFHPGDRAATRRTLGVEGTVLVSVGQLIERKGHHLVIEALADLPEATLLIVGEGPERAALERLAQRLGVERRVRFMGGTPHERLAELYTAADVLVLASSREGWANVLLEAMACGTPVVGTNIWGTPEVVASPAAGRLADARTPEAIVAAVRAVLAAPPERAATRRYAEGFSWDDTVAGTLALFDEVVRAPRERRT
jgi:glycosyltransferase involved in cell wall biosynthesis